MCLIYYEGAKSGILTKREHAAIMAETLAYCEELRVSGRYIASDIAHCTQPVTTVQVRSGSVNISDKPFTATERVDGFILIEARDLNDAIRVVSRLPSAHLGTIEIRPITELGPA